MYHCATYFDLQDVVSSKTLIVHLMVCIVRVTATFVLNEGETEYCVSNRGLSSIGVIGKCSERTVYSLHFLEPVCRSGLDAHIYTHISV